MLPEKVVIDKSGANKAALDSLNLQLARLFIMTGIFMPLLVRQIKYLNNIIEQDHRAIKKIINPMKRFKSFAVAKATLAGIELHHMLRKGPYADSDL
jgi:putative transposase